MSIWFQSALKWWKIRSKIGPIVPRYRYCLKKYACYVTPKTKKELEHTYKINEFCQQIPTVKCLISLFQSVFDYRKARKQTANSHIPFIGMFRTNFRVGSDARDLAIPRSPNLENVSKAPMIFHQQTVSTSLSCRTSMSSSSSAKFPSWSPCKLLSVYIEGSDVKHSANKTSPSNLLHHRGVALYECVSVCGIY